MLKNIARFQNFTYYIRMVLVHCSTGYLFYWRFMHFLYVSDFLQNGLRPPGAQNQATFFSKKCNKLIYAAISDGWLVKNDVLLWGAQRYALAISLWSTLSHAELFYMGHGTYWDMFMSAVDLSMIWTSDVLCFNSWPLWCQEHLTKFYCKFYF